MKKAVRVYINANLQSLFYRQFIKENAEKRNLKGFLRVKAQSEVELFLQGESSDVDSMIDLCKQDPKYSKIRSFQTKEDKLQDFTEFKIFNF